MEGLDRLAASAMMRPVKFHRKTDTPLNGFSMRITSPGLPRFDPYPQPILALSRDYPPGSVVDPHRHSRAQLLFATSGAMRVTTGGGAWIVPPLRAVWIPAGVEHGWLVTGLVRLRTLFIDPAAAPFMPAADCRVVEVSELLRALILAAMEIPADAPPAPRAGLIGALALDELARAPEAPLRLPMPQDPRLRRLCQSLLDHPARADTLESWADQAGASGKTIARLFLKETGLTFGAWRQQARLAEAVAQLALGRPISEVARAAGYDSASAFTAMFRRALGTSPRAYLGGGAAPVETAPSKSPCIPATESP